VHCSTDVLQASDTLMAAFCNRHDFTFLLFTLKWNCTCFMS